MKKIVLILALAFVVISACMIYLVRTGVSLRSAPIIRPSVMTADRQNIAHGVLYRLSPEFQNAHYVLWGFLPENDETRKILSLMKDEYEKIFPHKVMILADAENLTKEQLQACQKPCWLLLPRTHANELTENDFVRTRIQPLQKEYFNVTWMPFTKAEEVPEACIQEKRLTLECLQMLAVQEAQRRLKAGSQYFFMKKYNERDFFLFFQESPQL